MPGVLQNLLTAANKYPSLSNVSTFQHDILYYYSLVAYSTLIVNVNIAAVTRQMITDAFLIIYTNMIKAYHENDSTAFYGYSKSLLQAISKAKGKEERRKGKERMNK